MGLFPKCDFSNGIRYSEFCCFHRFTLAFSLGVKSFRAAIIRYGDHCICLLSDEYLKN